MLVPFNSMADANATAIQPVAAPVTKCNKTYVIKVEPTVEDDSPLAPIRDAVDFTSPLLAFYHGYKRNNSIGWALVWGWFGSVAPFTTAALALAQGFGEPIKD